MSHPWTINDRERAMLLHIAMFGAPRGIGEDIAAPQRGGYVAALSYKFLIEREDEQRWRLTERGAVLVQLDDQRKKRRRRKGR